MPKEYIEREAAIKDVQSIPISNDFSGLLIELGVEKAVDALNKVPAADVVEVVWCKDCEYWHQYEPDVDAGRCVKNNYRIAKWGDDFCSYGKRRGNEDAAD